MKKVSSAAVLLLTFTFVVQVAPAQEYAEFDTALLTPVRDTLLASESPGIVRAVLVQPGEDVYESNILVELNKELYEAELRVAEAEKSVAAIEASNDIDIKYAEKTYEVNKKLLDRSRSARQQYARAVTQSDMDRLRLELEQSQLSKRQAQLTMDIAAETTNLRSDMVEVAKLNLKDRDIKEPIDGRIEQIFVQKGQWVNSGSPIARVVDLKSLRVKAIFPVENYLRIKKGSSARFSYKMGEREFEIDAKVTYVNSVLRDNVFQVWVDIDNSDLKLIPGVQGKLSVELVEE